MNYQTDADGALRVEVPFSESVVLVLRAVDIARRFGRVEAQIRISQNRALYASSRIKIDDEKERTWLAGRAFEKMNAAGVAVANKEQLGALLLDFCDGLWQAKLGEIHAGPIVGNRQIRPEFLLRPYLKRHEGALVVSPPGSGKSYYAVTTAVTVDHGLADSPVGEPTNRYPVLYINLERSKDSMEARLGEVNTALGLPEDRPLHMINARGRTLADVREVAARMVREHRIELVVLDSLSRAGYGNLNDNEVMNGIMDVLNSFGCAWLAVAHPSRADSGRMGNSVMADAAADVIMIMKGQRDEDTGNIVAEIAVTKANGMKWPAKRYISLTFNEDGLEKIEQVGREEYAGAGGAVMKTVAERIVEHLEEVGDDWSQPIAKAVDAPASRIRELLSKDGRFVAARREGNRQYYALADRLLNPSRTLSTPLAVESERGEFRCSRCSNVADRYNSTGQPVCEVHG